MSVLFVTIALAVAAARVLISHLTFLFYTNTNLRFYEASICAALTDLQIYKKLAEM